jgi:hypothetical protein
LSARTAGLLLKLTRQALRKRLQLAQTEFVKRTYVGKFVITPPS